MTGDVWICSGQSNMEMGTGTIKNAKTEVKNANHQNIRLYQVQKDSSRKPLEQTIGEWLVCTPENIRKDPWSGFTAIGYFFGRQINRNLNVPVGLIQAAWGGTPIESWTSKQTILADPKTKHVIENYTFDSKKYKIEKKGL